MAKSWLKILHLCGGCFLVVALLSGCTTTYVPLSYGPQINVKPVTGAGAVTVRVEVTDARATQKDRIGAVMADGGVETGVILTTNDVAGFLKNVIETELTSRGFSLGGSNVVVAAQLSAFDTYLVHEGGLLVAAATGRVTMNVQVKRADGSKVFEKSVAGLCTGRDVSIWGKRDKIRAGVDLALQDAMTQLFDDEAFADALLKAAKP